jgi:hypothetical protein
MIRLKKNVHLTLNNNPPITQTLLTDFYLFYSEFNSTTLFLMIVKFKI